MPTTHIVKENDTPVGIALENGFYSWETISKHPRNESLLAKRLEEEKLYKLYIGDEIFIPDKTPKSVSITANKQYTFQRKSLKQYIPLTLEDDNGDPYESKKYTMVVTNADGAKQTIEGTTDAKGSLNEAVAANAQSIDLTLWPDDDETKTVEWHFPLGATHPPIDDESDDELEDD